MMARGCCGSGKTDFLFERGEAQVAPYGIEERIDEKAGCSKIVHGNGHLELLEGLVRHSELGVNLSILVEIGIRSVNASFSQEIQCV